MSTAADAGTINPRRSEPKRADAWPVSHGMSAPPKEALENTQPLLRQPSMESEAADNIKGKIGASPKAVTEAASRTCRLERETKYKEIPPRATASDTQCMKGSGMCRRISALSR